MKGRPRTAGSNPRGSSFGELQRSMLVYQQRREVLAKEIQDIIAPLIRRYKHYNYKIKNYGRRIYFIKRKEVKVQFVREKIIEYFHVDPVYTDKCNETILARRIMCKYILERGILGSMVEHVLRMPRSAAGKDRLKLTRGFKEHPDWKIAWDGFRSYLDGLAKDMEDADITIKKRTPREKTGALTKLTRSVTLVNNRPSK